MFQKKFTNKIFQQSSTPTSPQSPAQFYSPDKPPIPPRGVPPPVPQRQPSTDQTSTAVTMRNRNYSGSGIIQKILNSDKYSIHLSSSS